MTAIILHGGATKLQKPSNDEFFSLFTSLVDKQAVSIAMVYWARDRETWNDVFNRDKPRILSQTSKTIHFDVPETPELLLQKMSTLDVVFVAGGEAPNIEPLYSRLGGLKDALKGKVYIGSSMGAYMASANYVLSSDERDANSV
ncbi:MAG: Type 1 glutamine amidotransferase-like domain-containing protein, partial [bacterium]